METTDRERRLWSRMVESPTSVQARLIRDAGRLDTIEREIVVLRDACREGFNMTGEEVADYVADTLSRILDTE